MLSLPTATPSATKRFHSERALLYLRDYRCTTGKRRRYLWRQHSALPDCRRQSIDSLAAKKSRRRSNNRTLRKDSATLKRPSSPTPRKGLSDPHRPFGRHRGPIVVTSED